MKFNYVLWLLALVIVNSGWYVVSQKSATQEINRPGADFASEREASLSTLIGDESEYELEHCFDSVNGGIYNVSLQVVSESKILYEWNGTTDSDCISFSSSTKEGKITIFTEIEDGVEATANLQTWPLKSAMLPGMMIFSIGTVLLAFGETFFRKIIASRLQKVSTESESSETYSPNVVQSGIWQDPSRPV